MTETPSITKPPLIPSRAVPASDRCPSRTRRENAGNALMVASLLICAVGVFLWVRGHWTADTLVWRSGHVVPGGDGDWQRRDYLARSLHGRVVFWRSGRVIAGEDIGVNPAAAHAMLAKQPNLHHWSNEIRVLRRDWPAPMSGAPGWLGLRWQDAVGSGGTSGKLGVPLWMPVALTAVLPMLHLRRHLRARRVDRAAAASSSSASPPTTTQAFPS